MRKSILTRVETEEPEEDSEVEQDSEVEDDQEEIVIKTQEEEKEEEPLTVDVDLQPLAAQDLVRYSFFASLELLPTVFAELLKR